MVQYDMMDSCDSSMPHSLLLSITTSHHCERITSTYHNWLHDSFHSVPLWFFLESSQALAGALSLGYSNKVLNIYMAILDDDKEEMKEAAKAKNSNIAQTTLSDTVGDKLDPYTVTYNDEDLEKIVNYLKEWNTNAKHSFVSQAVLSR